MKPYPECHEQNKCFGQARTQREGVMLTLCMVLHTTYPEGKKCPFGKPKRLTTDGVEYPYKREYGKSIGDFLITHIYNISAYNPKQGAHTP